jgi:hypothetical protein
MGWYIQVRTNSHSVINAKAIPYNVGIVFVSMVGRVLGLWCLRVRGMSAGMGLRSSGSGAR